MSDPVISIDKLTKVYGTLRAVDGLDLQVRRGEFFGFLGPNGAGKTTTMRMLMSILVPSSGTVRIDGLDSMRDRVEVKRRVGYLPDQPGFADYLRGSEILEFVAQMHGQSRREARENSARLFDELALADAADDFAVNYSTGMKKKLGLACALIHDPPVLILDEPTNGLDPASTRQLQDRLSRSVAQGKTVFLSTHLLDMIEKLCTRVCIIHRGKLVGTGSISEITSRMGSTASLEEAFLELTRTTEAAA